MKKVQHPSISLYKFCLEDFSFQKNSNLFVNSRKISVGDYKHLLIYTCII